MCGAILPFPHYLHSVALGQWIHFNGMVLSEAQGQLYLLP